MLKGNRRKETRREMFAVQGWSVPATALKQQKEPSNQNKSQSQPSTAHGDIDTGGSLKSKKRKRGVPDGEEKITKSNLDGMWRKHIEGQTVTSKSGSSTNARKQQKPKNNAGEQKPPAGKKAKKKGRKEKSDGKHSSGSNSHPLGPRKQVDRGEVEKNDGHVETPDQDSKSESANGVSPSIQSLPEPPAASTSNLTPLQQSMRQKLLSSRFRHLNETLYTTPSSHAMDLFTANPELFKEYHAGFSRQVSESWPSNPVDGYVQSIKNRAAIRPGHRQKHRAQTSDPLPRGARGVCTFADLGCGDAQLARDISPAMKSLNLKFFSFDLYVSNPYVTKADISSLPLDDGSVDVTIFCLSLMGTNWISFVEEAWRILRNDGKGECWVSEVKSRFGKVTKKKQAGAGKELKSKTKKKKQKAGKDEDDGDGSDVPDEEIFAEDARAVAKGDDETDISTFIEVFNSRGFVLKRDSVDKSNKMFIKMAFIKTGVPFKGKWASSAPPPRSKFGNKSKFLDMADEGLTLEDETKALKPCVYKTR